MKKIFLLMLFLCLSYACEDVIEVDVPIDQPRLVVDALVRISNVQNPTTVVRILASQTSSFFEDVSPAQLDEISLVNTQSNIELQLTEETVGSGIYRRDIATDFLTSGQLVLKINFDNQLYEAATSFVPSAPIDNLVQGTSTLFTDDETEIIISFTDTPDRVDFYLFDFNFDEYLVSEDTFYPGQSFQFSYFYEPGLTPDTELEIGIMGADEPFYNYMTQLIVQAGGDQGPFQTPAATVKGNIVNITNPDNFALGYFALSELFTSTLIIEEQ